MSDIREWDALIKQIAEAAASSPEEAIRTFVNALADKIGEFDFSDDTVELKILADDLADVAWALRTKREAFIEAILRAKVVL